MTGAIPKYGKNFRREPMRAVYRDGHSFRAQRRYVSKANPFWAIRSNGNSEHWYITHGVMELPDVFDTLTEAMQHTLKLIPGPFCVYCYSTENLHQAIMTPDDTMYPGVQYYCADEMGASDSCYSRMDNMREIDQEESEVSNWPRA